MAPKLRRPRLITQSSEHFHAYCIVPAIGSYLRRMNIELTFDIQLSTAVFSSMTGSVCV